MSSKIITFLPLLLVTIFSNFTLCIRNEAAAPEGEERFRRNTIKFSADDAITPVAFPNADKDFDKGRNDAPKKFVFLNENQPIDGLSAQDTKSRFNKHQQYGEYSSPTYRKDNIVFNTGESYKGTSNNFNHYPTSSYYSPQAENYNSNKFQTNHGSNHQQFQREDPNYSQNNYAQNYYYQPNHRPNYNLRPTSPPRSPSEQSYQLQYPYEQQLHQSEGSYPQNQHPNHVNQQSSYNYPSYASLFNNFQAFPNPFTGLFSSFGNGGGPSNQLGSRITKALEDISANDDLNCVPKLLCQMIGNPERRRELPGFLSAPAISSLLAVLPLTSPVLSYGKAALLGYTGGEESCDKTYNKCPSDEDELLYYLNNHRGGFFRFFNGGGAFNDANNNVYDQLEQQHGQHPESKPQPALGTNTNQGVLQSILSGGDSLGLLGSLTSFLTPSAQSANTGSNGLVSIVGNLLGGLVNEGRANRLKRDADKPSESTFGIESTTLGYVDVNVSEKISPNPNDLDQIDNTHELLDENIRGRILNHKTNIFADSSRNEAPLQFPVDGETNNPENFRKYKEVYFQSSKDREPYVRYPPYNDIEEMPIRNSKKVSFKEDNGLGVNKYSASQENFDMDKETGQRLTMIFPDRTGTGNLRFDSKEFYRDYDREHDQSINPHRYSFSSENNRTPNDRDSFGHRSGKVLNRPSYSKYDTYFDYDEIYNKQRPYYSTNSHKNDNTNLNNNVYTNTRRPYHNRYESTTRRPGYYNENQGAHQGNRYADYVDSNRPSGGGNIYVTNSQGVVEYYIKPNGQKVYV